MLYGSITEYLISFLVEVILHTTWWDYSNYILNVNGRVCLVYSIFWGILTIFLIQYFNPLMDRAIKLLAYKISHKILKVTISYILLFLMLDCMATCYAQDIFITRMVIENDIEIQDLQRREEDYHKLEEIKGLNQFINEHWHDEKMIRTFPNMKVEDINGNIIYLDSLLPEIEPYYKKFFDK